MPTKTERSDDGKMYMVFPDGKRVELEDAPAEPPSMMGQLGRLLSNPEVTGGAAGILRKGGPYGWAVPPVVGAATSVGRDLYDGERNPATIGANALKHGALNALPGLAGGLVGAAKTGSIVAPSITGAIDAGANAGAATRLGPLLMKMIKGSQQGAMWNPAGTAAIAGDGAADMARGAMGAASAAPDVWQSLMQLLEQLHQGYTPVQRGPG